MSESNDGSKHHGSGYAFLVASGIFLSRIAGFVRERAFAHYFGSSDAAGAFRAGLKIPNLLQNLLGEGVLSASFIPVYARLLEEKKEEEAGRVAGAVAALLFLVVSVAVLVGVLLAPWLIELIVPGFHGEVRALTVQIVRILFPGTGILVMSAWCLGILNSHRKFFLSYVAPVLWNAAMIATMVAFGARLAQPSLAIALSWGMVAGALLQFLVQVPFVFRYGSHFRFRPDVVLAPVRKIVRNTGPVLVGRGAVQLSGYVDLLIASLLGASAYAMLGYAQTIYMLPVSLFGMSVAAAELPELSRSAAAGAELAETIRGRVVAALRQVTFFVVPSTVAFIVLGIVFVAALYQTGEFGLGETYLVWYILAGYSVGLLAVTRGRIYNSAFYALHDTKTPLKFALVRVATGGVLAYLFAVPLQPYWVMLIDATSLPRPGLEDGAVLLGAVGLTLGTSIGGWVEMLLLRRALQRRLDVALTIPAAFSVNVWVAALFGAGAGWLAWHFAAPLLFPLFGPSWAYQIAVAGVATLAFGVTYLGITARRGVAESSRLTSRITRRLRRS